MRSCCATFSLCLAGCSGAMGSALCWLRKYLQMAMGYWLGELPCLTKVPSPSGASKSGIYAHSSRKQLNFMALCIKVGYISSGCVKTH